MGSLVAGPLLHCRRTFENNGVKRGLLKAWQLVTCSVHHWVADNASTTGAALAFYCAFSLAPLLILILTLAGKIIGDTAANEEIASQLTAMFGPATAQILRPHGSCSRTVMRVWSQSWEHSTSSLRSPWSPESSRSYIGGCRRNDCHGLWSSSAAC
jgi:hypothetical protein